MTIELTEQQRLAIRASEDPPTVIDPDTKTAYVLLKTEVYERLLRLLGDDDGLNTGQVAVLIEEAMREADADDPLLESYQNYRGRG
jgi:hypothetical protein